MKGKVLIICPYLNTGGGGVANYFNAIKKHFTKNINFFFVGSRKERETKYIKPLNLVRDLLRLYIHLLRVGSVYGIVHINPSFLPYSIVRDGLILRLSKLVNKKCIVFFRGWDKEFAEKVAERYFGAFFSTYNKADVFIVLSSEFEKKLRGWGFRQPIFKETTAVDNDLLCNYNLKDRKAHLALRKGSINLLFLSRIEKEKGIIEAIEATKLLSVVHSNVRLVVAGLGSYLETARKYSEEIGIGQKVSFLGYISGREKKQVLEASDIFIFPTYHGEGMPNSVLEAMAFGIPIITRPVGGIKDFFQDGKFGFLTGSRDAVVIASLTEKIISNESLWLEMSKNAYNKSQKDFLASIVARRIECIYEQVV